MGKAENALHINIKHNQFNTDKTKIHCRRKEEKTKTKTNE